jgi:twitching motility protein PilJ
MPSPRGAQDRLANLTIRRKLQLALGVMVIPFAAALSMYIEASNVQIEALENEIAGAEYVNSLRSLMEAIPQHRALSNAVLMGDSGQRGRVDQQQAATDRAFSVAESAASKNPGLEAGERLGQLKREWQDLKINALKLSARESLDSHNRLMGALIDHVRQVGEKSNLISDSELDSYYLMDAVVNQLPVIADRVSKMGHLAANTLATKGQADYRIPAQALAEQVNGMMQGMQRNFSAAFSARPELDQKLNPAVSAAVRGMDGIARPLIEGGPDRFGSPDRATEAANTALSGLFALYDATYPNLRGLLESRAARLTRAKYMQIGLAAVVLLLIVGLVSMVNRSITGQIQLITDSFVQIGEGNYDVRVPVVARDELGTLAESMNSVLDNTMNLIQSRDERNRIQQSIQKLLDDISGVAAGDLTQEAEVTAEVTGAIADSFNYMISELRQLVSSVNKTTSHVGHSASQVLHTAESLAQGSVGQAKQIAEANNSIQQMARSIREVSATASTAATVAEQTFQKAKQGSEAVQKTIEGMGGIRNQVQETSKRLKGLGERSQEIGSIVQLIGDIADRTSILALNASIQAAMAGEAGRGFAVVAEEVERLAERAAEATKKVNTLIKSIQADTAEAITAMEETTREVVDGSNRANAAGRTLSEIESVSSQLSGLIQSISTASDHQARGSEHVSRSMNEISVHTQETAEGAKRAALSVQELAKLTDELRYSMQRFRLPAEDSPYLR